MDGPLWLVTLEHAPCWSHSDGCGSWSPQMRNIRGIRSHETLLRGLQVDPQLRSAVSESHTRVPSVTPAGVPCAKCASSEICAVCKACPFLIQPFCQLSDVLCVFFSSSQK